MSKALTPYIQRLYTNKDLKVKFILYINNIDLSDYLISWQIDNNKEFGSASATFSLNNDKGIFGEGGAQKIDVGDVIDFREYFDGDSMEFKRFYGICNQRSISKSASTRTISLVCLDYISTLQFLDIDLEIEADKVEITEEVLTPNYLDAPNDNLAQIFDFANDALADNPLPILQIRNKDTSAVDPLFDGFDVYYDVGQLKLGFPLNAKVNYDLVAVSYYAYTKGKYVEDIIETILTTVDGYGNYLFGETSAQAVIDNHLTETFFNVEGVNTDLLTYNATATSITIDTQLTTDVGAGSTTIYVTSTAGFPTSGEGNINGDVFTWTGKTATTLTGIPATGTYALHNHKNNSYVEYTYSYPAGQVWYLKYSNTVTTLVTSDFVLPNNVTVLYQDKRNGRIILDSAISISFVVKCNTNYSFKTLQATGIQLNKISFRSRETENRFETLSKIRKYLAPNYVIRTIGNNKIWADYLSQATTADYTLQLETGIDYMEDEDLYTRVIFYRKNKNPTNLMFNDGVDFVTTGESYKATATNSELTSLREEISYYVYGSSLSGVGKITANTIKPIVYVNGVSINNTSQLISGQSVIVETTTRTESTTEGGGKSLLEGTLIELENGSSKLIEDVELGDVVREGGKIIRLSHSKRLNEHCLFEFTFKNNKKVIATWGHNFEDEILDVRRVYYEKSNTYDILPANGYYYANGIKTYSMLSDKSKKLKFWSKNKFVNRIGNFLNNLANSKCSRSRCANTLSGCMCGGGGGGETTVTSHTYYYYKVKAPHNSIDPSQSILCYNAFGVLVFTIAPYDTNANYGMGIYSVPGTEQNTVIESISTATYHVFYSTSDLIIDYENAEFKISKTLIRSPAESTITATYQYITIFTPFKDVASVIDGRWDTQVQTEFFAEPPTGYNYSILDLGATYTIQALDIGAGFYKPDEFRRFDVNMNFTMQYSTDGTNYYDISDETHNFNLAGGQAKSFEEDDLGIGFQARYLKLIIEDVKRVEYGDGVWVVAISEIAAYNDIFLKSEATLISTSELTNAVTPGDTVVYVSSTAQFDSSGTAYIGKSSSKSFTYTGKFGTYFTGCVVNSGVTGAVGNKVTQTIETDTTQYDDDYLLQKLGDRVYKSNKISEEYLYTQAQLDYLSKRYLREFYKNHSKIQAEVLFSPHIQVGHTVQVIDTYNNTNSNYFVESISNASGFYRLVLAKYPA